MDITKAILKTAKEYSELNGYILVESGHIFADKDSFWGNLVAASAYLQETGQRLEFDTLKYIIPEFEDDEKSESRRIPEVHIDMNFGNPRINIRSPRRDFCCLTYEYKSGKFIESQAFGENGIELSLSIKQQIENNFKHQDHE